MFFPIRYGKLLTCVISVMSYHNGLSHFCDKEQKKINKQNKRGTWRHGVRESAPDLIKSKMSQLELNEILLLSLLS